MENHYLTPTEAGERLGLSQKALAMMRCRGRGPKYAKISYRVVRYAVADLDAWMRDRTVSNTSEQAAA